MFAGVVNRGDSFRRRRSRSNSLVPPGQQQHPEGTAPPPQTPVASPAAGLNNDIITYRVAMIGASGVGKTALVSQFMTSECINAYDRQRGVDSPELNSNLDLPILGNKAQHESSALANYASEAGGYTVRTAPQKCGAMLSRRFVRAGVVRLRVAEVICELSVSTKEAMGATGVSLLYIFLPLMRWQSTDSQ
uniref:Uncharacterized protein n=1 Tax=Timema cristinae TaxID=61476 RepID=A0A7R9GRP6_TIMCR|nr:unnamed protein product [Timema cristinae]